MRASDCTDTLLATSLRSAVFLRWTKRAKVNSRRGGKSQALGKFGWESAAWMNRSMRALVFL